MGLAAPQIEIDLRIMVFGLEASARYPDEPPVPTTVLINPSFEVLGDERAEGWEGCLSIPLRGEVSRAVHIRRSGDRDRACNGERDDDVTSRLLANSLLIAATVPLTAAAQDVRQASGDDVQGEGEVVATGSRIARPDLSASTPVQVVSTKAIQRTRAANIQAETRSSRDRDLSS